MSWELDATAVIIIGMLSYFNEQDKRIAANKQDIEFIKVQRAEDLGRIEKSLDEIKELILNDRHD